MQKYGSQTVPFPLVLDNHPNGRAAGAAGLAPPIQSPVRNNALGPGAAEPIAPPPPPPQHVFIHGTYTTSSGPPPPPCARGKGVSVFGMPRGARPTTARVARDNTLVRPTRPADDAGDLRANSCTVICSSLFLGCTMAARLCSIHITPVKDSIVHQKRYQKETYNTAVG